MAIRKVLVVDDEPQIRRIGELALRGAGGWEVSLACSGVEALSVAAAERPDLILLDVMMPEMDGPATLAALRERAETRAIPVIFMTATAQRRDIQRYLALGARGVIPKPFDPLTLPDQVRRIHEGREDRT